MTAKEEEDDPRNTNNLESKGQQEVEGPKAAIPDIEKPLKTR